MFSYYHVVLLLLFITELKLVSASKHLKIQKCCALHEVIFLEEEIGNLKCVKKNLTLEYSNVTIFDKDVHDKPIGQVSLEVRHGPTNLSDYSYLYINNPYLNSDGILYLEIPNAYDRWNPVSSSNFCVDYQIYNNGNLSNNFQYFCIMPGDLPQDISELVKVALVISQLFLFMVLLVYMLLPGLRNLCGMILMAYVFSLLCAFLFLSALTFGDFSEGCFRMTITIYFFFLASFCWMNVMSYDIWWTFRGYAKARPIHRRGETFKFLMYCIYGWGVPLAMTIFFKVINSADLSDKPWFVKPLVPELGCFIEGGQKLVYLYAPMLILIICNWIFFLMTAVNIWRLNRETAMLDSPAAGLPAAHRNQRARFFIYLKLSIIMGINWVLEVVSALTPQFKFWFISDLYNILIGLSIFLIFVCKKKIYLQLKARFRRHPQPQRDLGKSRSATLSNSNQDTPMKVYTHPNGSSVRR